MRGWAYLGMAGLLAAGAFALRPGVHAQPAATDSSAANTRERLAEAEAEAERARNRATALDRQAREATLASERATLAAAALAARVQQAEAALAAADTELEEVRARRQTLDRQLARERSPVARLLAALEMQVRRPPLLALLQPGSVEDAVHLRAVVAAVGPQIAERTVALRASLENARDLEGAALALAQRRRKLNGDLLARRSELATAAAAERLKAQRAAGAADREAVRALTIAEQARDVATLVRRVEQAGQRGQPAASQDSSRGLHRADVTGPSPYRLPVTGVATGNAEKARGNRREAITLATRPGALVVAPGAGRVAFAGPYRGYGAIVIIEHSGGWTSLVTGLASAQVRVGQDLVAGSPLGLAPAQEPRIGLELRKRGRRVDPLRQLR